MSRLHRISIGSDRFSARSGQRLLDAALANGVELPHDCRAGRCGACQVRVKAGITMGGQSRQSGVVYACQSMVFSDLDLELEEVPPEVRMRGTVAHIQDVAPDIVEVVIDPAARMTMLPGQYCRFRFRGFPARPFSPTSPMTSVRESGYLYLHIKRVRGGRVTPHLGTTIKRGHAVTIEGPLGHAYLRPGLDKRLVLIGSGTGFAPIWAVAAAALRENADRRIVLVAASRKLASFYMSSSLDLASRFSSVCAIGCVEELDRSHGAIRHGNTIDHVPQLSGDDIVYAAGAPVLVDAIGTATEAVGATLHADPFTPTAPPAPTLIERAKAWLEAG